MALHDIILSKYNFTNRKFIQSLRARHIFPIAYTIHWVIGKTLLLVCIYMIFPRKEGYPPITPVFVLAGLYMVTAFYLAFRMKLHVKSAIKKGTVDAGDPFATRRL